MQWRMMGVDGVSGLGIKFPHPLRREIRGDSGFEAERRRTIERIEMGPQGKRSVQSEVKSIEGLRGCFAYFQRLWPMAKIVLTPDRRDG